MKIFFDTEFYEDGLIIDLISIGMVREDGLTYYAEVPGAKKKCRSEWLKANVMPHLTGNEVAQYKIAKELIDFVGEKPEFWAYYADYDWVMLCQLYGTMMQLPKGWPMFCMDIKQLCVSVGNPRLPEKIGAEHHALADAKWNKLCYEFLVKM